METTVGEVGKLSHGGVTKSESIIKLAQALNEFQSIVPTAKKDASNPFFKSKYATLENVIDTIRAPMSACGLSFAQFPSGEDELTTILMHVSGEYIMATAKMSPVDKKPQSQGSAITYMRRYALSAVLGIASEEDDDGNAASTPKEPMRPYTVKRAIPPADDEAGGAVIRDEIPEGQFLTNGEIAAVKEIESREPRVFPTKEYMKKSVEEMKAAANVSTRDKIKLRLKVLGHEPRTVSAANKIVKELTGLSLTLENSDTVLKELNKLDA